jgi:hypothetical protein
MIKYKVGDLFCAAWDEKELYIITRKPEKDAYLQDVYFITCMRTCKAYGYNKEDVESLFRKVA